MKPDWQKRVQPHPLELYLIGRKFFDWRVLLLLPRAFLVAIGAQLFAPFVFVDFCFSTFF
jgi:hypothetical protein